MTDRDMTGRRWLPVAAGAALAAALPLLAGCATAPAGDIAAASQRQDGVIPFASVTAARDDGTGDYLLNWVAPDAGRVTVYAGHDPAAIGRDHAVGAGDAVGSIRVSGLAPGKRWFFALVPERGAPLVIADRGLHLPSVHNLRDIGGYRTSDGRWVKMGLIYRSDQLDKVSEADLAAMGDLGIRLVADLRTESERQREPDRLPAGAEPLVLDVAADSQGSLGGDMRKAMAAITAGKGAEMLTEANRDFVSLGSAKTAYRTLLDRLDAPDAGPTLYHCTAGKDRTGWATAVILTLLGVPRETVMADYLASNDYLRAKNEKAIAGMAKMGLSVPRENLEPVLGVRAEYLQAAFDEVDKRFGSFDAYLKQGLGLGDAEIEALRTRYLAGRPA
ncbi:protein tyrosine phosphatase [Sphingomonas laterariae]|uniref:Protein tyrosine phosphatase n=1 Tax=Edaphosphingomonas laterariae TaxID=861865 RepID=A0A239ETS7_9SPHN|nr:tyrosine-protein phosphatase [Sphingomonas laterariae]SNS47443.1 protein tyrosine phosphatase [Sphingomonas laterariae]